MRNLLTLAVAGMLIVSAIAEAAAQTRSGTRPRTQTPTSTPTPTPANPYGLANCAERPFARDCDRRGTW